MLLRDIIPQSNTLHHCKGEQNPFLYYFNSLFKDYIEWPFLDSASGMFYPNNLLFSSQLPGLTYSVIHRSLTYILGVSTIGYFNLAMSVFLEWATISLDDQHLLQKGKMNSVTKLLNEKVKIGEKKPIYSMS
jgi:hypothetical protein